MIITVFGAGGFIGSELVKALGKKKGISVYAPLRHDVTTGFDKILARDLGHIFYCIGLTANFREHPF